LKKKDKENCYKEVKGEAKKEETKTEAKKGDAKASAL